MSTVENLQDVANAIAGDVTATMSVLESVDLKLDEVLAFIRGLQGNQPVTQEQLDQLVAQLIGVKQLTEAAKVKTEAVLTEADALDNS